MSQEKILEILEKNKKPMSRSEIAITLSASLSLISHNIARLIKAKDIKIIEIDREQALKIYHCKRRMRLYYIG
jgi:transcriptional regulator of NAD metabolism